MPRKTRKYFRKKGRKSRKARKGGFMHTTNFGWNGFSMNKTTGSRRYNWKTGKWDYEDCYGIGSLKHCVIRPDNS